MGEGFTRNKGFGNETLKLLQFYCCGKRSALRKGKLSCSPGFPIICSLILNEAVNFPVSVLHLWNQKLGKNTALVLWNTSLAPTGSGHKEHRYPTLAPQVPSTKSRTWRKNNPCSILIILRIFSYKQNFSFVLSKLYKYLLPFHGQC